MVSSNDVQRLFLQGVFSRGILSFKHAQVLWEKCIEAIKGTYRGFDLLLLMQTLRPCSCKPNIGHPFL